MEYKMKYSIRKVFYPRLGENFVWKFFCEYFGHEQLKQRYYTWFFMDDDKDSIGTKWLLENGAVLSDIVILDMA